MGPYNFASDNAAGVHPEILQAIVDANEGHALAYGNDEWTRRARATVSSHFGDPDAVTVEFVFGGTGANMVALGCLLRPTEAILAAEDSHVGNDECGAPESLLGVKVIGVATEHGKITPDSLRPHLHPVSVHAVRPGVLTVSQATEWGTVYSVHEVRALTELAHAHGVRVHLDGARIANAAASLGCEVREFTTDCGVDAVSFGGTKNGMLFGEAVVFPNKNVDAVLPGRLQKQMTQLPSKMRFVAAQFERSFGSDLWRDIAQDANAKAKRLARVVEGSPHLSLAAPVHANGVFARMKAEHSKTLQSEFIFHEWSSDGEDVVVRWMTSFVTSDESIEALSSAVKSLG